MTQQQPPGDRPAALVVYESMFGNSEWIAAAVTEGLCSQGLEAAAADVRTAPDPTGLDLLVVGAPTHAFSLSRASTRQDAVRQGAPAEAASTGLREWLMDLARPSAGDDRPLAATFDTRVRRVRHVPATASRRAARLLVRKGYRLVVPPRGFVVEGVAGPLGDGELADAADWGREVALAAGLVSTAGR